MIICYVFLTEGRDSGRIELKGDKSVTVLGTKMIEGINSSIATASLLRPVVEQEMNARGQSASIEPVQRSPQAPYVSPYLFVDNANNKVILQIRDSESGDVVRQIPSDSQIRAYNKASDRPVQNQSKGTESSVGRDSSAVSASVDTDVDVSVDELSSVSSVASSSGASSDSESDSASSSVLITA